MRVASITLGSRNRAFSSFDRVITESPAVTRDAVLDLQWVEQRQYLLLYRVRGRVPKQLREEIRQLDVIAAVSFAVDTAETVIFAHHRDDEPLSSLLDLVTSNALLLDRPLRFTNSGLSLSVIGDSAAISTAFASFPAQIEIAVDSTSAYNPGETDLLDRLTDRQRFILETALELGYYDQPREVTYEEIAEAAGCSTTTANDILRRAESQLVRTALVQPKQ